MSLISNINIVCYVDLIPCGSSEIVLNGRSHMFGKADRDATVILEKNVRDLQRQTGFVRSTALLKIDGVDGKDITQNDDMVNVYGMSRCPSSMVARPRDITSILFALWNSSSCLTLRSIQTIRKDGPTLLISYAIRTHPIIITSYSFRTTCPCEQHTSVA